MRSSFLAVVVLTCVAFAAGTAAARHPTTLALELAANFATTSGHAFLPMCVSSDGQHRHAHFTKNADGTCRYDSGYVGLPGSQYTGTIKSFPFGTADQ